MSTAAVTSLTDGVCFTVTVTTGAQTSTVYRSARLPIVRCICSLTGNDSQRPQVQVHRTTELVKGTLYLQSCVVDALGGKDHIGARFQNQFDPLTCDDSLTILNRRKPTELHAQMCKQVDETRTGMRENHWCC